MQTALPLRLAEHRCPQLVAWYGRENLSCVSFLKDLLFASPSAGFLFVLWGKSKTGYSQGEWACAEQQGGISAERMQCHAFKNGGKSLFRFCSPHDWRR
jgi:hypothetical protein